MVVNEGGLEVHEVTVVITMFESDVERLRERVGTSGVIELVPAGNRAGYYPARVRNWGSLPDPVRDPDTVQEPDTSGNVTSEPQPTDHREFGATDFTGELRLCDDAGMVSDLEIEDPEHQPHISGTSYLDRHNARSGQGQSEPFACTGSAHFGDEHVRCTSPAHKVKGRFIGGPADGSVFEHQTEDAEFPTAPGEIIEVRGNREGDPVVDGAIYRVADDLNAYHVGWKRSENGPIEWIGSDGS